MPTECRSIDLPVVDATPESVAPFGRLIDRHVEPAMDIPYYKERVIEGGDVGFRYRGRACIRTSQVLPGDPTVSWLERHVHLTQLFVALGRADHVMVLGPPNHQQGKVLPELDKTVALRFPGATALLLHQGTWHDFPLAWDEPVTFVIANSEEVISALQLSGGPRELDEGDVRKVMLQRHFGVTLRPLLPARHAAAGSSSSRPGRPHFSSR